VAVDQALAPPTRASWVMRSGVSDPGGLAMELGSERWVERAETLKRSGASAVLAGRASCGEVVVKCQRLPGRVGEARSRLMASRLARQWRGAERLRGAGIATAGTLMLWRGRDAGGALVECLAMERLKGRSLLHWAADAGAGRAERAALARGVGELTGRLVSGGLFNRDHKPSNVVVLRVEPSVRLALVDTVGIRKATRGGTARMLANLLYEVIGTGTTLDARERALVWRGVAASGPGWLGYRAVRREVEALLASHGGMRPEDDPLG
jgi:tRNA A-37 threonylcarbamoyl transferase component Bud32